MANRKRTTENNIQNCSNLNIINETSRQCEIEMGKQIRGRWSESELINWCCGKSFPHIPANIKFAMNLSTLPQPL